MKEAFNVWEKFGFKYMSLREIYKYNFKDFIEKTSNKPPICDYLQKYSISVQK